MAAVTLLGSVTFNTSSGTKTVTATPAVGDLIVIITAHTGNISGIFPNDNNADGLSAYTSVIYANKNSNTDLMSVYIRNNFIGSATSTIFQHPPSASTGGGVAVLKVTGMQRTGINAIRQSANQENQGAGGTPAPVLANAILTANTVIGAVFNASNVAGLTPRSTPAYTERADVGYNGPTTGLEIMSINLGEIASTITWGSTSATAFSSFVAELDISTLSNASGGWIGKGGWF